MPGNAGSLGSYLRWEREQRAVGLQEISAVTKIQRRFLQALEEDQYDQLPPAPFVVGFLRAYAEYLSLEPEEILEVYRAQYAPAAYPINSAQLLASSPAKRVIQGPHGTARGRTGWRVLSGIGLGLAGLLLYVSQYGPASDQVIPGIASRPPGIEETLSPRGKTLETPGPAPALSQNAADRGGSAEMPAGSEEMAKPAAVSWHVAEHAPEKLPVAADLAGPLVLQVDAVEAAWLRIAIDGEKRQEVTLTAGSNARWEARERFVMTVGNTRGVRVTLNGRDIPLPGTRGNVLREFLVSRALLN